MTILCSSSRALALLALALAGCAEKGSGEACTNEDSPALPGPPDTAVRRARVTAQLSSKRDEQGAETRENDVSASLVDVSTVIQTPRTPTTLMFGCYGLTGSPTTGCRPGLTPPCTVEQLEAEKVTVTGLAQSPLDVPRVAKGSFLAEKLADPLFSAGGKITARVTGRNDKGFMPTIEASTATVTPLALTAPQAGGAPLGSGDLKIHWPKGDGDYVVIDAQVVGTSTTDKIQCVVADDGCHTIAAGDLDLYEMKVGTKLRLTLRRETARVQSAGDATLEVKAVSRVELILTR